MWQSYTVVIYIYIYIYIYRERERNREREREREKNKNKVRLHCSVLVLLNHHQDVRGFISHIKCRWMYKKCKNTYENLEKLCNKKSWLFMIRKIGRLINKSAFCFFKIRHLTLETLCRIHVRLVHQEISNHSSFSTKFKSYKSVFEFSSQT